MRSWLLAAIGLIVLPAFAAFAQAPEQAQVVANCGTPQSTYVAGSTRPVTQNTAGVLCGPGTSSSPTTVIFAPAAPAVSPNNSATSLVLLASPTTATGGVKYFHAENATTTGGYCILYNAVAAPAPGALTAGLVLAFQLLPASGYCDWTATNNPVAASAGATLLISSATTPYTYTTGTITAAIYGLAQ